MAKKLSAQTVTATAKTLQRAASTLSPDEERAIRMRTGIGLAGSAALEHKAASQTTVGEKLAQIELQAFKAMGKKIYGIGTLPAASTKGAAPMAARSPKDKIIKALKQR